MYNVLVYGLFAVVCLFGVFFSFFLANQKIKFDENVLNNPRHNKKSQSQGIMRDQFQRIIKSLLIAITHTSVP